jgi:hypothetical protein
MNIALESTNTLLDHFDAFDIIPETTKTQLGKLTADHFLFKEQLELAESIHLHIKVPDTAKLPHKDLLHHGGNPQNEKEGYIKYAFDSGVHLIFSSIPVSEEERAGLTLYNYPHLDHIGIDIRKDDSGSYEVFNKIPSLSEKNYLPFKRQGGDGQNVYCCHVSVNEKYWVYPKGRPHFEFAFGPLNVSDSAFGCDLRPADPALMMPEQQISCCGDGDALHDVTGVNKTTECCSTCN